MGRPGELLGSVDYELICLWSELICAENIVLFVPPNFIFPNQFLKNFFSSSLYRVLFYFVFLFGKRRKYANNWIECFYIFTYLWDGNSVHIKNTVPWHEEFVWSCVCVCVLKERERERDNQIKNHFPHQPSSDFFPLTKVSSWLPPPSSAVLWFSHSDVQPIPPYIFPSHFLIFILFFQIVVWLFPLVFNWISPWQKKKKKEPPNPPLLHASSKSIDPPDLFDVLTQILLS